MLADYCNKMHGTNIDAHKLAKRLKNIAYDDVSKLYPIVDFACEDIYKEITTRSITLPQIKYEYRRDKCNGKLREIGISSMKQQLYDYIAVNICMDMFMAKIGTYQCASIKGRGQIYGKKAIEKWIRKNPRKCKYIAKCDIKKYYPSVDKDVLKRLLDRDIGSDDVRYIIFTLIDTYKQGLCIGSYLSQFLANYLLSYAYHFLDEQCFKIRRGKRINLVYKKLFYMDDVFMCGASRNGIKKSLKMLEDYLRDVLHLSIKQNWEIYSLCDHPTDMMGYKINKDCTTIRRSIFRRADKHFIKYKHKDIVIPEKDARSIVSRYGYFKHSDSRKYMKKMKVLQTVKRAKEVVRHAANANKR